jgi:hypothetical protein
MRILRWWSKYFDNDYIFICPIILIVIVHICTNSARGTNITIKYCVLKNRTTEKNQ